MIDHHIKCQLISIRLKDQILIWLRIKFYAKTNLLIKFLSRFSNFLNLMKIIYQHSQKNGHHYLDLLKLIQVVKVF